MKIKRRSCPALVGRKEAARILGVKPENLFRDVPEIPEPLQDRKIKGFEVTTGPLWPLDEILELASQRWQAPATARSAKRKLARRASAATAAGR
jgi:hypothetical protein